MEKKEKTSILFVMDSQLSLEKAAILTRSLSLLGQSYSVNLLKTTEITDKSLSDEIQSQKFDLILVPLKQYLGILGQQDLRGSLPSAGKIGSTFASYVCEPTSYNELPQEPNFDRSIILDLFHLAPQEVLILVRALVHPALKYGIHPLLSSKSLIYCENWNPENLNQGSRVEQILSLPEITSGPWKARSSAIPLIVSALGNWLENEIQLQSNATMKAYFQLGIDENALIFRLYYTFGSNTSSSEILKKFWPKDPHGTSPLELLTSYSDFLRVHFIPDAQSVEIIAGIFTSAPSEKNFEALRTLWIEPIPMSLINETPFETPNAYSPNLRALPSPSKNLNKNQKAENESNVVSIQTLREAQNRIKTLEKELGKREDLIQVISNFQQKYFDARYQIRQFEIELSEMLRRGASEEQAKELRLKMEAVANREKAWIKRITELIQKLNQYKKERNK